MKKVNIAYWICTILISGMMLFSAIPNILCTEESVKFITHLGYPQYFIPFIGVAKLLGVIAILIPGFPRIKEWAYAGLFFDLAAATYSFIALGALVEGGTAGIISMCVFIGLLLGSYFLYHKKMKLKAAQAA